MIIVYIQGGFVIINLLMAWWHSALIKKQKRISHGIFGAGYLLAVAIVCIITHNWLQGPPLLFLRQLVVDPALNVMRVLPVHYTPKNPKSIIDQVENKLFGPHWNAKIATYIILFIVTEVILIMSYA